MPTLWGVRMFNHWMTKSLLGLAMALALLTPASAQTDQTKAAPHTLIVVSIDGYRADYIKRGLSPHLEALKARGVYAHAMRPSYPTVTAPNHYTLMTGLYPDHHGVIDNNMVDPKLPGIEFGRPSFAYDNDPRWWDAATPLWVSAVKSGMIVAASAWPGQASRIHNITPNYLQTWQYNLKPAVQSQMVLSWLSLPQADRPRLILLHYLAVDEMGHAHGPDTPQVNAAISDVSAALGELFDGLKQRGLMDSTNLVVVSDHGMSATSAKRTIWLDDLFNVQDAIVPSYGAFAGITPKPGHTADIEKALLKPNAHMTCWKKADIPARLHFGSNPRVPAIWCEAKDGWLIMTHAIDNAYYKKHPINGEHGYDPSDPKMAALFVAVGPDFKSGVVVPDFPNIDIYPMLARLLGITPLAHDGDDTLVHAALK